MSRAYSCRRVRVVLNDDVFVRFPDFPISEIGNRDSVLKIMGNAWKHCTEYRTHIFGALWSQLATFSARYRDFHLLENAKTRKKWTRLGLV